MAQITERAGHAERKEPPDKINAEEQGRAADGKIALPEPARETPERPQDCHAGVRQIEEDTQRGVRGTKDAGVRCPEDGKTKILFAATAQVRDSRRRPTAAIVCQHKIAGIEKAHYRKNGKQPSHIAVKCAVKYLVILPAPQACEWRWCHLSHRHTTRAKTAKTCKTTRATHHSALRRRF